MSSQPETLSHDDCSVLLPLYVHGKLGVQDQLNVVEHLRHCNQCQTELQLANRVRDHFHLFSVELTSALSPERMSDNFDRLWTRIETEHAAVSANNEYRARIKIPSRWYRLDRKRTGIAAGFAFTFLFVFLAAGTDWFTRQAPTDTPMSGDNQVQIFHTLASPPPNSDLHAIRAVFTDDTSLRKLKEILTKYQADIISGPGTEGVYTLKVSDPGSVIVQLRADPNVLLAEPVSYE